VRHDSEARLDESEVPIRLAAFAALGILAGLAAEGSLRRRFATPKTPRTDAPGPASATPMGRLLPPGDARRRAGVAFNKAQEYAYPHNEVPIVKPGGGRPNFLDSYDDVKGEIVFRRDTQFSEIQFKTAKTYFREFVSKYPPGARIANVPSAGKLAGEELMGQMIFEVPPQWKSVPKTVLDEATRFDILIRDSNGRIYNAH
jgi:filamentous hemagglutinin